MWMLVHAGVCVEILFFFFSLVIALLHAVCVCVSFALILPHFYSSVVRFFPLKLCRFFLLRSFLLRLFIFGSMCCASLKCCYILWHFLLSRLHLLFVSLLLLSISLLMALISICKHISVVCVCVLALRSRPSYSSLIEWQWCSYLPLMFKLFF